jgi:hypothetical protein
MLLKTLAYLQFRAGMSLAAVGAVEQADAWK